jgi:uncharacterized repeat protein (TIGR01451 family)
VDLEISIRAAGDEPSVGAKVKYSITIRNSSASAVNGLNVWDTLPANLTYIPGQINGQPVLVDNVLFWDMSAATLAANSVLIIDFWVEINAIIPGDLIETRAWADYYDPHYVPALGRHPPVSSSAHFYPEDTVVVFPNPFNPRTAKSGTLKFLNAVPGSIIRIFTISGEAVIAINTSLIREEWDGKNRSGQEVSAGIYYYIITNQENKMTCMGKIYIIYK